MLSVALQILKALQLPRNPWALDSKTEIAEFGENNRRRHHKINKNYM